MSISGSQNGDTRKSFSRLPGSVVPLHYDLLLSPDLNAFTFNGFQTIQLNVNAVTSEILLNSAELKISQVAFKVQSGAEFSPVKTELDEENETVKIVFSDPLPLGDATLEMSFSGVLNDKLRGFYRSKYTAPDGKTERYAAVTQLAATDARRMFPCWDEPAIKATFNVTLEVPTDRVAISNMPSISEESILLSLKEGQVAGKRIKYDKTPIMATYLVAVAVGEFDYVETKASHGTQIRIYTPVGKKEQGEFVADVAKRSLDYYEDYFGIKYPLPKMDLLAITDFALGAMENWGLIIYRETCLLVDPANTSAAARQRVALIVAHEIAHQWFGNLVTMEWWSDLWLNEGYASFVEYLAVDHLFPQWDIWAQFVADEFAPAQQLDAMNSSHPIEIPVQDPHDIISIFDFITYRKGASILRMLHYWLSDETFRKGMNYYLTKHSYSNAKTEDLWDALEQVSKKPVRNVMTTWTKQKGFPLIKVEQSQAEGNKRTLTFTQEKFVATGTIPVEDSNSQWLVPIAVISRGSSSATQILMEGKSASVTLENVKPNDWVVINPNLITVCRIQYSADMLSLLIPAVEDGSLSPIDRLAVVSDLMALVSAGKASSVELLRVLSAYKNETNYRVWLLLSDILSKMNLLLGYTDFQELFKSFGRRMLNHKIFAHVGWEPASTDEQFTQPMLRSLIIDKLAAFGDERVLAEAAKRFGVHINGTALLPADLRAPVYRAIASHGEDSAFEKLFTLYRTADLAEEKVRILSALGATTNPDRIQRILKFALSDEVRTQDSPCVIISASKSAIGARVIWSFIRENMDEIVKRYEGNYLFDRLYKGTLENLASDEDAADLESFFREKKVAGIERAVSQAIESVRIHGAWLARDSLAIKRFLSQEATNSN